MNRNSIKRILFYTGGSYGFRSMPIWYVYEISQVYPVILLSEKLDPDAEEILNNKNLFPKLEKIVPLPKHSLSSPKMIIKNNRLLYKTAKNIVEHYKPDVVIVGGKNLYPFALYLRRVAKKIDAINICPLGPQITKAKEMALWSLLTSAHLGKPAFLPFTIRLLLVNLKKNIGHFVYYWFLPPLVGEAPFKNEPGCTLFKKNIGKSADYYLCLSKEEYNLCISEGLPSQKLYITPNPYPVGYEKVREFFKKKFRTSKHKELTNRKRIITLMWPDLEIGIQRGTMNLISKEEMKKSRINIITLITEILKEWEIFIKPHPGTNPKQFSEIKNFYGSIFPNIKILDPSEWADAYTEISDVIIGFPPVSITLYTASIICREKPIISLDLGNEILGDCYKNFNGIEYINEEHEFINVLKLIQDNKYSKPSIRLRNPNLKEKEFEGIAQFLKYLTNEKR